MKTARLLATTQAAVAAGSLFLSPLDLDAATAMTSRATYEAKDFSHLVGMPGFEPALLQMHFQLYHGYVKQTNALLDLLEKVDRGSPEFGALKRRVAWEYDGMRLHELYFENMGGRGTLRGDSALYQKIERDFGSFKEWKQDFIATGEMRGIGWAVLYRDSGNGRLYNAWINEHDTGLLVAGEMILVMDVFEHAYLTQFGLDRGKYIDTFFQNINWSSAEQRYGKKK